MDFNLRQLETFLWVATLGNFRKAAEKLHTTQPAISARIATLEDALGVKLLVRNTSSTRLTAKGQELLSYAEKVLKATDLLRERAGDSSRLAGVLRLGVSETIVHTILPKFLSRLHETYPDVDVELSVDVTVNLRNELVSHSLDLAFLMGPISDYSIENIALVDLPLRWFASPSLNIPTNSEIPVEVLANFTLLTYARNTRPFIEISKRLRDYSSDRLRIFPSSSLAACLRMTIDGMGIGTFPRRMVEKELGEGTLVEIPCAWAPENLNFTASYATNPFDPVTEKTAELAQEVAFDYKVG